MVQKDISVEEILRLGWQNEKLDVRVFDTKNIYIQKGDTKYRVLSNNKPINLSDAPKFKELAKSSKLEFKEFSNGDFIDRLLTIANGND